MPDRFAIIVPARAASTRFSRKLLHEIDGKPIILWTAERIRAEAPEFPLHFAVDGEELRKCLDHAGYDVLMTDAGHTCGTDRIAEANTRIGASFVINVQADEPMVTGRQIRQLAEMVTLDVDMATLGVPFKHERDFLNPNHVKCVCDLQGRALYFSRAPIPYFRDANGAFDAGIAASVPVLNHLGLYAFKAAFLERFAKLPQGKLENMEKLEMLRVLEAGGRIQVGITTEPTIAIDTPQQADEFEALVKGRHRPTA